MGEEIALSMRAWTHGWDIYAPRQNLIAHQYRPGVSFINSCHIHLSLGSSILFFLNLYNLILFDFFFLFSISFYYCSEWDCPNFGSPLGAILVDQV